MASLLINNETSQVAPKWESLKDYGLDILIEMTLKTLKHWGLPAILWLASILGCLGCNSLTTDSQTSLSSVTFGLLSSSPCLRVTQGWPSYFQKWPKVKDYSWGRECRSTLNPKQKLRRCTHQCRLTFWDTFWDTFTLSPPFSNLFLTHFFKFSRLD